MAIPEVKKPFMVKAQKQNVFTDSTEQLSSFALLCAPSPLPVISHGDGPPRHSCHANPGTKSLCLNLRDLEGNCGKSWDAEHMEEDLQTRSCCRVDSSYHMC